MAEPPISVIMPCYNGMPFILSAFNCVLQQDYPNMEILLADDCSSDGSCDVIEKLVKSYSGKHRIRIIRNEKRLGIGNYNRLVDLAEHDFMVMAHADDLTDSWRVSSLVRAWRESGAVLIASNAMMCTADNKDIRLFWTKATPPTVTAEALARRGRIDSSLLAATFAWHRDLFDRFGPIDPNKSPIVSDWILPFRAALLGGVYYLNEPLVRFRRHAGARWKRFFAAPDRAEVEAEARFANAIVQRRYMQETLEQFLRANPDASERFAFLRRVLAEALDDDLSEWTVTRNRLMALGLRPHWADSGTDYRALVKQIEQLQNALAEQKRRAKSFKVLESKLNAALAQQKLLNANLVSSASWRITAPLRSVIQVWRSCLKAFSRGMVLIARPSKSERIGR